MLEFSGFVGVSLLYQLRRVAIQEKFNKEWPGVNTLFEVKQNSSWKQPAI